MTRRGVGKERNGGRVIISTWIDVLAMADDIVLPIPNLTLPQHLFVLSNNAFKDKHNDARSKLLDGIQADRMFAFLV